MKALESLPLQGLLVLDFSQFLAGPGAALRLADLGATVIKVERPGVGDLSRQLALADLHIDGDSALFQTINRNKRSYAADLKDPKDLARLRKLIARADVMIENFRPGVMERLGLDHPTVRALNPRLIYGSVTGHGREGPWSELPGQDLLAQSRTGLVWLSGDGAQGPVPVGLALVDIMAGAHLTQGILACLVRRSLSGVGGLVEVSLLESALDLQFEGLTTYLNDGGQPPVRSTISNANPYLAAPYGLYATLDGHLALAMGPLGKLAQAIDCAALAPYAAMASGTTHRDDIKKILATHLATRTTRDWLERLEAVDYWCAPVMDWRELLEHDAFKRLAFVQDVTRPDGSTMRTTRCPIRIDGSRLVSPLAAPRLGEHNDWVEREFGLEQLRLL